MMGLDSFGATLSQDGGEPNVRHKKKTAMEEGIHGGFGTLPINAAARRGGGLPPIRSGGGRAVPETGYNADIHYLVAGLWRFKDTKD